MSEGLLKPISETEVQTVENFFSDIHRMAARLFTDGYKNGVAKAWSFSFGGNEGAFSIVFQKDYVVCYAAFKVDPSLPQLFTEIHEHLREAMNSKGDRPLFFNVRGDNKTLINQMRMWGFKQDTLGYELVCRDIASTPVHLCGLDMRGYQFQYFDAYVALLDGAFNPLIETSGGNKDAFWRGKEGLQKRLAALSDRGDFVAFWLDHALVGLYYLAKDEIEVLAVHKNFQNRGYGGIILRHATHRLLHQRQLSAAFLLVSATNQRAKKLYLRKGYQVSGFFSENTYVGINI